MGAIVVLGGVVFDELLCWSNPNVNLNHDKLTNHRLDSPSQITQYFDEIERQLNQNIPFNMELEIVRYQIDYLCQEACLTSEITTTALAKYKFGCSSDFFEDFGRKTNYTYKINVNTQFTPSSIEIALEPIPYSIYTSNIFYTSPDWRSDLSTSFEYIDRVMRLRERLLCDDYRYRLVFEFDKGIISVISFSQCL